MENKTPHKTKNCIVHKNDNLRDLRVRWCDVRKWICIGITILVYFLITYGLVFADYAQAAVDVVVDGVPRALAVFAPSGLIDEPQHNNSLIRPIGDCTIFPSILCASALETHATFGTVGVRD